MDTPGHRRAVQDNVHKGTNLTGIDPVTRRVTRLYHPRRQNRLALREALLDGGEFPPRLP